MIILNTIKLLVICQFEIEINFLMPAVIVNDNVVQYLKSSRKKALSCRVSQCKQMPKIVNKDFVVILRAVSRTVRLHC